MKFFMNKSIWSKIVIILVFILLFQFVVSKPSLGKSDWIEGGGKLLQPVISLVVTLGDGVMDLLHSSIMGVPTALLSADLQDEWYEVLGWFFKAVLFCVGVAIAAFVSGGFTIGVLIALFSTTRFADAVYDNSMQTMGVSVRSFAGTQLPNTLYLPLYTLSPEEIFQGKILLFNVDFFGKGKDIIERRKEEVENVNEDSVDITENIHDYYVKDKIPEGEKKGNLEYYYYYNDKGEEVKTSSQNLGQELRDTISKWYVSLRNIGLVMMMIILLYIGIRIILSSLASDKAKYKEMLKDWAIGMALLFLLHYIMVFSNFVVNQITKVVSSSISSNYYEINLEDSQNGKLSEFVKESGYSELIQEGTNVGDGKTGTVIGWPTNLMGKLRIQAQMTGSGWEFIGYAICFLMLVVMTIMFIFTYLKRVLYMAFLTLMAPLVAVTYPIDKLTDGKAQGFDKWFKEYIFNLLIQPLHLLLYYILITSAFNLAGVNIVYSIIAIGFMLPAEKMLRGFFGFEKSSTAPSAAMGAGMAMALGGLMKPKPPKPLGKGGNGGSGGNSKDDSGNIRVPKNSSSVEETLGAGIVPEEEEKPKEKNEYDERQEAIDQLREEDKSESSQQYLDQEQIELDNDKNNAIAELDERQEAIDQLRLEDQSEQAQKDLDEEQRKLDEDRLRLQGPTDDEAENTGELKPTLKKPSRKQRMRRYASAMGQKFKAVQRENLSKIPGGLARLGGNVVRGAIGGVGAFAATAALTGDPTKAITSGVAGAATANRFKTGISNKIDNSKATSRIKGDETPEQAVNRVNNSKEYREIAEYDQMKKAKKDAKRSVKANFGEEETEILKEGGAFEELYSNGVTDYKDIQAIIQMKKEGEISDYQEGIAVAKAANEMGDEIKGSKEGRWRATWSTRYQEKLGVSTKQADQLSKKTMDKSNKFNKFKKDLE